LSRVGISPALPLVYTKEDGPYGLNKTIRDSIQQNFKNILLTSKGERVMLPDFGVGLRSFLFRNFTPGLLEEIRSEINKQVALYLPFIEITEIDFISSTENADVALNELQLRIRYEIMPINETDTLTIFESIN
jgi:phage baseplate assembly protein W